MAKFSDITFPFFGLYNKPQEVSIKTDRIDIKTHDNLNKILYPQDIKSDQYIKVLASMLAKNENRIIFDYTALNLQSLIVTKPLVWGVDNTGKIFNLTHKERFPVLQTPISKRRDGLLWFKHVSYPFSIPFNIEQTINEYSIGLLVYIDLTWYIYEINHNYQDLEYICI